MRRGRVLLAFSFQLRERRSAAHLIYVGPLKKGAIAFGTERIYGYIFSCLKSCVPIFPFVLLLENVVSHLGGINDRHISLSIAMADI